MSNPPRTGAYLKATWTKRLICPAAGRKFRAFKRRARRPPLFAPAYQNPDSGDEVLAHAQAWHPAEAVVLAFLKGMHEMRLREIQ